MTLCEDDFREFVWHLLERMAEKNERIREHFGAHDRWDWDPEHALLTFFDHGKATLRAEVTLAGTTEGRFWEWSWANPNIDPLLRRDMERVREFGESRGYRLLTEPFVEADKEAALELTAVAAHVLNALGSFYCATGDGFCFLIYRKVEESEAAPAEPPPAARDDRINLDDDAWDEPPKPLSLI